MSERAASLATAFENANNDLIAAVEACTDDQLRLICAGEGWSVAVSAHHVASAHGALAGFVTMMANGQPLPPVTMEIIDAGNAQHATEYANVSRADTLAALKREGSTAAALIRSLTDAQLDNSAPMAFAGGAEWSTADLIERVMIGHPLDHGKSVREAVAG